MIKDLFVQIFSICIGFHQEQKSLLPVNNQSKINEAVHSFIGRVSLMALITSVFFFSGLKAM